MMNKIMINEKKYIISWVFTLSLSLFLVIRGFNSIKITNEGLREDFLFLGILIVCAQLLLAVFLLSGHYKVRGRLKRISKMGDLTNQDTQRILNRLGDIGKEINYLLSEQNQLSQLRAGRIAALNTLARQFCMDHRDSILYTDVKGSILGYSDSIEEKLKIDDLELMNMEITSLWPELPISEILQSMQKQGLPWTDPEHSGISCSPIFDRDNNLHFCVWGIQSGFLKKIAADSRMEKSNDLQRKKRRSLSSFINMKKFMPVQGGKNFGNRGTSDVKKSDSNLLEK